MPASALTDVCGVWSSGPAWVDHIRIGDAWWYEPREAVTMATSDWSWPVGRVPQEGVVWDGAERFRPASDMEVFETKTEGMSPDRTFVHLRDFPATGYRGREIRIVPTDIETWVGLIILCDAVGALILHYADVD